MDVANKWSRGKLIGKGSYGSVSIAIRDSDGGQFAVKSATRNSFEAIQALENEINIYRSLSSSSPFIVSYYGDDETTLYKNLHLEYLPGGDVAKSGAITDVDLIRSYTWCLVTALKEVHSKGIVHCDVKGSNVLVGPTRGVAKLSDFGSSKTVTAVTTTIKSYSQSDFETVPRGSPLWMAPEVVRGESQGYESDIWSVGCTVIEMFTGMPAWRDYGARTLIQIGYTELLPDYPCGLPEFAKEFLDMCLKRDKKERWSCDQLLQHPFLLPVSATMIIEPSPRSIFDWQNLDFSDDDDEEEEDCIESVAAVASPPPGECVRGRIGELATTVGVNWESDGWVEVRSVSKEKEEVSVGTSWEYSDLEGVVLEIQGNDYPTWNIFNDDENDECSVSGGDGGDDGGRCSHGESSGGMVRRDSDERNVIIELLLSFALLRLFVLYSFTRNKISTDECYIGLLNLFTWLLFSSWNMGESGFKFTSCYGKLKKQRKVNTKSMV